MNLHLSAANRARRRAMTLVEILVVLSVLVIVVLVAIRGFLAGSASYQANSWKQERLAELQLLLRVLQKDLTEASNLHAQAGITRIDEQPRPLHFRSVPPPIPPAPPGAGGILAFRRHHLNGAGNLEYGCDGLLNLEPGGRLVYRRVSAGLGAVPGEELQPPEVVVTDVAGVVVQAQPVILRDSDGCKTTDPAPGQEVGAMLSLSFVLRPSPHVRYRGLEVVQNAKIELNVWARGDLPAPNVSTYVP